LSKTSISRLLGPPSILLGCTVRAFTNAHGLWCTGFDAESEEEASVYPGDEIIVHQEVEGWYQITRVADQTRGLVPASYVQVTA